MEDLLREFLELALEEMKDARVPNQLRSRKSKKSSSDEKNEMSTVAGSLGAGGGYTAPLGASAADMLKPGSHPVAGKKVKKHKKTFVRNK